VKAVVKAVSEDIPCNWAAASADLDTIERYLDDGIAYIIIARPRLKDPISARCLLCLSRPHNGGTRCERTAKLRSDGWSKVTGHDVIDLAKKFQDSV